jgi:hypothetical protein
LALEGIGPGKKTCVLQKHAAENFISLFSLLSADCIPYSPGCAAASLGIGYGLMGTKRKIVFT